VQLNWYFGAMDLEEITAKDIHAYTKKRLAGVREIGRDGSLVVKRAVSPGTVRKELTIMRAVFNFMAKRVEPKELRVDSRHLCYIELPPRPGPRFRVLSEKEIGTIRQAIQIQPGQRMDRINRYLWLLMETGARSSALRTLTWDQVDLPPA
jgi:integrase